MPKKKPSKEIDGVLCFQCTKCWEFLPADDFVKNSKTKFWISSSCKKCKRNQAKIGAIERNKEKRIKYFMKTRWLNREDAIEYMSNRELLNRKPRQEKIIDGKVFQRCNTCLQYKPKEEFWTAHYGCIECEKKKDKKYNMANREVRRKKCEDWHKENKDKEKEYYKKFADRIKSYVKNHSKDKSEQYGYSRDYFHIKARNFKKENWIIFDNCAVCGAKWDVIMHHPSYENKEMREYIVPVCYKCHVNIHNWYIECPDPIRLTDLAKEKQNGKKEEYLWSGDKKI